MGPKKGKGGKDKAPKMDEAMLAEFKRQQQATAKVELRAKMEAETKNSKINNLKITNQWRKIMRLAKTEALKKDIEILSQNHERDVDRKDAILQMLDRDLEEAEDQYQMALKTHLSNIDTLIKLHDTRLYALERSFQQELKTIQNDFNNEKESFTGRFKQEKKDLKAIIDAIENEEDERENEARTAFEQLREEIRNRNLEEINMLRISLDAQIEELEQHFETAHLNYLQQTVQRTHDFKELTMNDQRLSQEIDQKKKKIDSLLTNIQHWRGKIRHLNRETEERNRLLLEEKLSIQKHYQQLKQRIQVYRGTQNQRLLHLSQCAHSCQTALKEKLEVARRVLGLNELSRKLETTSEMILPFIPSDAEGSTEVVGQPSKVKLEEDIDDLNENTPRPPSSQVIKQTSSANLPPAYQSAAVNMDGRFIDFNDRMANFYRKYNKIILDNIAIENERNRLVQENAQLEDLIEQFLAGNKLTGDTLAEDNPLFVVNGRASLNYVPPVRDIGPTVQEGNFIRASATRQYR